MVSRSMVYRFDVRFGILDEFHFSMTIYNQLVTVGVLKMVARGMFAPFTNFKRPKSKMAIKFIGFPAFL